MFSLLGNENMNNYFHISYNLLHAANVKSRFVVDIDMSNGISEHNITYVVLLTLSQCWFSIIPEFKLHRYWIYGNIAKPISIFYILITPKCRDNILSDVRCHLILELQALGCDFLYTTCTKLLHVSLVQCDFTVGLLEMPFDCQPTAKWKPAVNCNQ